ncbi:hypothetical protein C8R45DRAFT_405552 [Mycena sanguinolenta]|nr:hypothetical protein C8R45DRAFT_405552 [Mycena sanguinolenta]
MAEDYADLKAKIDAQEKQLELQRRKIEKMRAKNKKSKLIPCPKGQAGRGKNGYNLKQEMRLEKDAPRFQRIERYVRAYANWYLPTGKTISEQEPAKVDKLIKVLQQEVKYFQMFQGGWPIRAILKQYLRNAGDKLRRDLALERAAEAEDGEDFICETNSISGVDGMEEEDGDVMDDDDDEDVMNIDGNDGNDDDGDNDDGEDGEDGNDGEKENDDDGEEEEEEEMDVQDVFDFEEPSNSQLQLHPASWVDAATPKRKKVQKENEENITSDDVTLARQSKRSQRAVMDSPVRPALHDWTLIDAASSPYHPALISNAKSSKMITITMRAKS